MNASKNISLTILISVLLASFAHTAELSKQAPLQVEGEGIETSPSQDTQKGLTGSFHLEKDAYLVGEPIFAAFEVTNNRGVPFSFYVGGDYRGHPAYHRRFSVEIRNKGGRDFTYPPKPHSGGVGGSITLKPHGEKSLEYVLVSSRAHLLPPGDYSVEISRTLNHGPPQGIVIKGKRVNNKAPTFSDKLHFTIKPYDFEKLKDAIAELGGRDRKEREGAKTFFRRSIDWALLDVSRKFEMGFLSSTKGLREQVIKHLPKKWDDRYCLEVHIDDNRNWLTASVPEEYMLTFTIINNSNKTLESGVLKSRLYVDGQELKDWQHILSKGLAGKEAKHIAAGDTLEFSHRFNRYVEKVGKREIVWKVNNASRSKKVIVRGIDTSAESNNKPRVQVDGKGTKSKDTPTQIQSFIEDFAKGHDAGGRVAYKKVVQIGKPAIPYLKEALKDSRKNVRWISGEALGAIGGQETAGPLVLALRDSDKDVRIYAAWFLGDCGQGNEAVSVALINVLRDANPGVVWHAMGALERLGETSYKEDMDLVDSLCLHLDNPDHHWREDAAKALGMVGNPRACEQLVNVLASETHGSVVFAIKEALVKIRSHNAVPLLLALLQDSTLDRRVYPSVAGVLRELGDPNINDSLLPLAGSSNETLRSAAIDALGFAKNIQAIPRLTEIISDSSENSRVREYAAKALGRIGNIEAVDALDKALVDESAMLRREAAKALGRIRCPQAVDTLIRALNDSNVFVVMYATESLGKLGDKKAVEPIIELFDKGLPDVSLASNPLFANLPTVAHHALVAIMKGDVSPQKIETISNQGQLKEIREAWRIKLGLQEESPSSSSQLSKGIAETKPDVQVKGDQERFLAWSIETSKETFYPGEPVLLKLKIKNNGDEEAEINFGMDGIEAFSMEIRNSSNKVVAQGGHIQRYGQTRTGTLAIPPGKTGEKSIVLNQWCSTLLPPGKYHVMCHVDHLGRFFFEKIELGDGNYRAVQKRHYLPMVTLESDIEVINSDDSKFKKILDELAKCELKPEKYATKEWLDARAIAREMIAFTGSALAVPYQLRILRDVQYTRLKWDIINSLARSETLEAAKGLVQIFEDPSICKEDMKRRIIDAVYRLRETGKPSIINLTDEFVSKYKRPILSEPMD